MNLNKLLLNGMLILLKKLFWFSLLNVLLLLIVNTLWLLLLLTNALLFLLVLNKLLLFLFLSNKLILLDKPNGFIAYCNF